MMHLLGPCHKIYGRKGYLGQIQAVNLWQGRRSLASAKEMISNVACLSYGWEAAKSPESLVARLLESKPVPHGGPFEFVPLALGNHPLPTDSLRGLLRRGESPFMPDGFSGDIANTGSRMTPAVAFLVEAPIFVARQWMRHRSFAYNEMSRRFVSEARVGFRFYGDAIATGKEQMLYELAVECYNELIASGEPPELARRVIPVGTFTRFWVGGYTIDWKDSYLRQRNDSHAQIEIRQFAQIIDDVVSNREVLEWIGPDEDEVPALGVKIPELLTFGG